MIFVCWRSRFTSSSARRNGFSSGGMNVRPCAFKTPIELRTPNFKDGAALAGRAGRIIERAQKAFFVLEQFHDFLLVPQMVAAGDDVHARRKNFPGGLGGDAGAAGGVFAVGDDEIERVLLP